MSIETSLSKRIKRHVIGRVRTYFAATAPGFESLCLKELKALALPIENASAIPGGVEFKGRLTDCYLANLHLRTANRILMRIDQFKAYSFSQIQNKAAGIPWELFLLSNSSPRINVKTHHCRLYHSDAIGERFSNTIAKHIQKKSPASDRDKTIEQTIFIRGVDDRFIVSIDSSGDHLHKRGLKTHPGKAPLRETTAAAALLMAEYQGNGPLIDPMCGTGTFSLEAAMVAGGQPPGWFRKYAFMEWPSFRPAHWEHLKNRCEMNFSSQQTPAIFASDKDSVACDRLNKCLAQTHLAGAIKVTHQDFFEFLPKDLTDQTGLVAINPPYGRRLETRRESSQLFTKICTRLKREYKGWNLILISPNKELTQGVPFKLAKYPISHGGMKPVMMIGTI